MLSNFITPTIRHLWELHWVFRINPFEILYFIVGPSIIWYIKPHMCVLQRYLLMISALVLSYCILAGLIIYSNALMGFAYKTCASQFKDIEPEEEYKICKSYYFEGSSIIQALSSYSTTIFDIFSSFCVICCSPFWGGVRMAWRIYHRKTIREMEHQYRWKLFDDFTIIMALCGHVIYYFITSASKCVTHLSLIWK